MNRPESRGECDVFDSPMLTDSKNRNRTEFGDYQTPAELVIRVCGTLSRRGISPNSIIEPNCGQGNFLVGAHKTFPQAQNVVGVDINDSYLDIARSALESLPATADCKIERGDFFTLRWYDILRTLPDPLLIIGNPPWVTNSTIGEIGGSNLPTKSNFHNLNGIDAITGKSNFDISEWMISRMIDWIDGRDSTLAMLCKTSVARKIFLNRSKSGQRFESFDIYSIDARKYFSAAVDACLMVVASGKSSQMDCSVYDCLEQTDSVSTIGYRDGSLVANIKLYDRWKFLLGGQAYKWRSGIKHDCARVMELRPENGLHRNSMGELVDLEDDYIFPMLKSSDVARDTELNTRLHVIVPQRRIGEDTEIIKTRAPKTATYLKSHADLLEARASSIYRGKPPFSIFGVGEYSFAPWKVAIAGLYKKLEFKAVGPRAGKPTMLDDTCYFIPCQTEDEALTLCEILNSDTAREFYSAFVFWDAKRPVTSGILNRLNILALARVLGLSPELEKRVQYQHEMDIFA